MSQVNEFLQLVIEFSIPFIGDGHLNLLDTLRRIFDSERFFYMQTTHFNLGPEVISCYPFKKNLTTEQSDDEEEEEISVYAEIKRHEDTFRSPTAWVHQVSPLLVRNANFFGSRSGYQKI